VLQNKKTVQLFDVLLPQSCSSLPSCCSSLLPQEKQWLNQTFKLSHWLPYLKYPVQSGKWTVFLFIWK